MRIPYAALPLALCTAMPAAAETSYPVIPEPMIFDMMRPLGAAKGELEVNTLVLTASPFKPRDAEWAPEVEYAFADGKAVEVELPFDGGRLAALKLGLQAAFGASADGRSAHGVQYLGVYDRRERRYASSLLYMAGHRFSRRWSTMAMIGLDDLAVGRRAGRNALLLNQATFYDAAAGTVLGVEVNAAGGSHRHVRLSPQVHQRLSSRVNVQVAAGVEKERGERAQPLAGVRLVREF